MDDGWTAATNAYLALKIGQQQWQAVMENGNIKRTDHKTSSTASIPTESQKSTDIITNTKITNNL